MDFSYKRTNVYESMNQDEIDTVMSYNEGYKDFLNCSKTERETVSYTISLLKKSGYKEYHLGDKISPNEKLFLNNRGKGLFILKTGKKENIINGIKILVAHVDSPRLDLKQVPLYEKDGIAFFKTHYYGGIKKYQWLTIPLALHGVVCFKDGSFKTVCIGENDDDPVFYITDLLPHLSQEINTKTIADGFPAENLNILIGGIPSKTNDNDSVKKNILIYLNKQFGMSEEDFLSAELEIVPAFKAKDVGFDKAYISSYGHDDRVCAYPEVTATIDTETDNTVLTILADKEEIGSVGNSGMQCILIKDFINIIANSFGIMPSVLRQKSKCLSADVTSAYDPDFVSAFEENNVAHINRGVAMSKFTGSRGKSGSNDASAEYIAYLRGVFEKENIIWQTGELGKVDLGGGGTVAQFIANNNIETVDLGVPVLSMHSPNELVSKADVYCAYKAFCAFIK